jgi:hypothetical protein
MVRRNLIKRVFKVKPDVHLGCVLLSTEKINVFVMKVNVLVSAFISYSILMLVKYSLFRFKLSVIPVAYAIKMKSGGCASPCSVLALPLCNNGCCAKPFAVENTLYSRKERMHEGRSDSDAFTQAV